MNSNPIKEMAVNVPSATESPEDFSFPFKPYNIQVDFMRSLYKALNEGKIGIFESPTGTVSFPLVLEAMKQELEDEELTCSQNGHAHIENT